MGIKMRSVRSSRTRYDNSSITNTRCARVQSVKHVRNSPVSIVPKTDRDDHHFIKEDHSLSSLTQVRRPGLRPSRNAPNFSSRTLRESHSERTPDGQSSPGSKQTSSQQRSFSKPRNAPESVSPPTVSVKDLLNQLSSDIAVNKTQTRVIAFHTSRRRLLRSRAFNSALRATRRLVSTIPNLRTRYMALESAMECDTAIASYQLKASDEDNDVISSHHMERSSSSNTASSSSASTLSPNSRGTRTRKWARGLDNSNRDASRPSKKIRRKNRNDRPSVDVDSQNAKAHLHLARMKDDLNSIEKSLRASRMASELASCSISCAQDVFVLLSLHVGVSTTPRAARGKSACGLAPLFYLDDCDDISVSKMQHQDMQSTPPGGFVKQRRRLFARRASAPEMSSLVGEDVSADEDSGSENGLNHVFQLPHVSRRRSQPQQRAQRQDSRDPTERASKRSPPTTVPDAYVATLTHSDRFRNEDLPLYVPFADDDLSST